MNMQLGDLDLFVLALLRAGLGTVYDFKVRAGLSVGSTGPVLERLSKAGLAELDRVKTRNARRFTITKAGVKALESNWESLLDQRPTDFEAALRITFLAWTFGGPDRAAEFAHAVSKRLKAAASSRRAEAEELQSALGSDVAGEAFRWLRTFCDAPRLDAQADALKQAVSGLGSKNKERKRK